MSRVRFEISIYLLETDHETDDLARLRKQPPQPCVLKATTIEAYTHEVLPDLVQSKLQTMLGKKEVTFDQAMIATIKVIIQECHFSVVQSFNSVSETVKDTPFGAISHGAPDFCENSYYPPLLNTMKAEAETKSEGLFKSVSHWPNFCFCYCHDSSADRKHSPPCLYYTGILTVPF